MTTKATPTPLRTAAVIAGARQRDKQQERAGGEEEIVTMSVVSGVGRTMQCKRAVDDTMKQLLATAAVTVGDGSCEGRQRPLL